MLRYAPSTKFSATAVPNVTNLFRKKIKPLELNLTLIRIRFIIVRIYNQIKEYILDIENTNTASIKHYTGL